MENILEQFEAVGIAPELLRAITRVRCQLEPTPRRCSARIRSEKKCLDLVELPEPSPPKKKLKETQIKSKQNSFRDVILANVNLSSYHLNPNQDLINLARLPLRAQSDTFIHDSKPFIVISCIATARLFWINPKYRNKVYECKRLPERYISLVPNLITSLHCDDFKLYLAFLWANGDGLPDEKRKPYLETWSLKGEKLGKAHFYDSTITSIYSDENFIFVLTKGDLIYIHRKDLFHCVIKKLDFKKLFHGPLVSVWLYNSPEYKRFTKLSLLVATTKELLVITHETFDYKVTNCYRFKDKLNIVSLDKNEKVFILHRNLNCKFQRLHQDQSYPVSKIELGWIGRVQAVKEDSFIHEISLSFNYHILQVRVRKEYLFVLGCSLSANQTVSYELGCLYMPNLRPIWITHLAGVDETCQLLVHDDFVVIISRDQQVTASRSKTKGLVCKRCKLDLLSNADKKFHQYNNHVTLFTHMEVLQNETLANMGASSFKKLIEVGDSDE